MDGRVHETLITYIIPTMHIPVHHVLRPGRSMYGEEVCTGPCYDLELSALASEN